MKRVWIVGLAVAAIAAPAAAQVSRSEEIEQRQSSEYGACEQRSTTDTARVACLEAEFRRQDAELNRQYAAALRRLSPAQHARLRTAQRAWVAWRDADCATLADPAWSYGNAVDAALCRVTMTIGRTIDLENYHRG